MAPPKPPLIVSKAIWSALIFLTLILTGQAMVPEQPEPVGCEGITGTCTCPEDSTDCFNPSVCEDVDYPGDCLREKLESSLHAYMKPIDSGGSNYCDINTWDVSRFTSMNGLFSPNGAAYPVKFNEDISCWNVSQVTSMYDMFYNAADFNQDIDGWDTAKVTQMRYVFDSATSFNEDINGWDTSEVTDMHGMFVSATNFNQPLNEWNTAEVTDMSFMFSSGSGSGPGTSFNQDIDSWDVGKVTDMSNMFQDSGMANDLPSWCANPPNGWACVWG